MVGRGSDMGKGYTPKDHFFKQAKAQGFRARSAFKIEEIARRFSLVKKGGRILDMGAAPGGFLQVLADIVGPSGLVVGVDLVPIKPFSQSYVKTAVLDVLADDFDSKLKALYDGPLDAVISDLAPKTTGIKTTDEARSQRLAQKALDVAIERGKPGSHFVAKLFMGGDFEQFRSAVKAAFGDVKIVRPEATRGASMEIYIAGIGKKGG
ncbi:MAG: SAM-dependent methyltransferase [Myxococcaceae bacterium]